MTKVNNLSKKRKSVSFVKWGYIFITPFFVVYFLFSLVPLLQTFFYSFFEYYKDQLDYIGPNWIGLQNYLTVFTNGQLLKYAGNTIVIWLMGFVPQIIVSLGLAIWFTDNRLKLRGTKFFKTIIYMPNLVMASAFAMLFLTIFAQNGPIINMLFNSGIIAERFNVNSSTIWTRSIIALINFLMWFGNTTILLMAGVMGIDPAIYESATIDGAGSFRTFRSITLPLLMPIFIYVIITSLIGGIQLFDIPQIFTQGVGSPDMTSKTLVMYLYNLISVSKNYGLAGAVSVVLFVITGLLSFAVFRVLSPANKEKRDEKRIMKKNKEIELCKNQEVMKNA